MYLYATRLLYLTLFIIHLSPPTNDPRHAASPLDTCPCGGHRINLIALDRTHRSAAKLTPTPYHLLLYSICFGDVCLWNIDFDGVVVVASPSICPAIAVHQHHSSTRTYKKGSGACPGHTHFILGLCHKSGRVAPVTVPGTNNYNTSCCH